MIHFAIFIPATKTFLLLAVVNHCNTLRARTMKCRWVGVGMCAMCVSGLVFTMRVEFFGEHRDAMSLYLFVHHHHHLCIGAHTELI